MMVMKAILVSHAMTPHPRPEPTRGDSGGTGVRRLCALAQDLKKLFA